MRMATISERRLMIGDWRGSMSKLREDNAKLMSAATERMVLIIKGGMGRASAAVVYPWAVVRSEDASPWPKCRSV